MSLFIVSFKEEGGLNQEKRSLLREKFSYILHV